MLKFTRYAVLRREPYARFLRRRGHRRDSLRWPKLSDRAREDRYRPWAQRHGFPFWMEPIPGYWERELGPRYQATQISRGYFQRKHSA